MQEKAGAFEIKVVYKWLAKLLGLSLISLLEVANTFTDFLALVDITALVTVSFWSCAFLHTRCFCLAYFYINEMYMQI